MKNFLLVTLLFFISSYSYAVTYYSIANGNWSSGSTWSTTRGGSGGLAVPGAGDAAVIDGHNVTLDANVTVATVVIRNDVANGLQYGGGILTPVVTLTITDYLGSVNSSLAFAETTAQVIQNHRDLRIKLTGTTTILRSWGYTAGFPYLEINSSGSPIADTGFSVLQDLIISSGTFSPGGDIRDSSGSSVFTISDGATLSLNDGEPINGAGGATTSMFNKVVINGTITQEPGTSNYINSISFQMGATGTLNINYNGSNQTQGWWHTTNEPTTVSLDAASTVNYAANANQNIGARSYGNLSLSAGSTSVNKTIAGGGNFIVQGNFSISSSTVNFSSTNTSTNLDFQGNITNEGSWGSFSNTNIRFTGASAQSISGGAALNIPINLISNNSNGVTFTTGVIFNGTTTISGTGTGNLTFDNITVASASSLTPAATLTLTGNFANNGTFNHNNGTVTFTTSGGTISGSATTTFHDVVFSGSRNNDGIVEVASTGTVTLGSSVTLDADGTGSGTFTLLSNSETNAAKILAIPSGSSVAGNIITQRFMQDITASHGTEDWRYISSPVASPTVADLQAAKAQEFLITGSFTGSSTCGTCSTNPSMHYYDESVPGVLGEGWIDFPTSSNTETLDLGRGYIVWQRDENSPVTLELNSTLNQGNISLPVSFTNGGTGDPVLHDGWNLVGNPYPAPIDWKKKNNTDAWVFSDLNGNIYLRDNHGYHGTAGDFVEHNGSVGVPSSYDGVIPQGQAFYVKSDGGTPSLTVKEGAKVNESPTFLRIAAPDNVFRVRMVKSEDEWDEAAIHFREDAVAEYENDIDAVKLENYYLNMSTLSRDNVRLVINSMPASECSGSIPLYINPKNKAGTYALTFNGWNTFTYDVNVALVDTYTGNTIEVDESTSYSFDVTSDAATYGGDRFRLEFSTQEIRTDNINVETPVVCAGNAASVVLNNAQIGVTYAAEIDGKAVASATAEGGELNLDIPSEHLSASSVIALKASNSCQAEIAFPETYEITVSNAPASPTVKDGETCGSGSVTVEAEGAAEGNYRWYTSTDPNADPIEGAVNSQFVTGELKKSQEFYVAVLNENGCVSEKATVKAVVNEIPQPEITQSGDYKLVSNYAEGNQWYFNNEPIPGATGPELEISQSGVYSVEVNVAGCSARTDMELTVTAVDKQLEELGVEVYPNPVGDILTLNTGAMKNPHMQITTVKGQVKYTQYLKRGINDINVSRLEKGLYLIKIRDRNDQVVLRIMKK